MWKKLMFKFAWQLQKCQKCCQYISKTSLLLLLWLACMQANSVCVQRCDILTFCWRSLCFHSSFTHGGWCRSAGSRLFKARRWGCGPSHTHVFTLVLSFPEKADSGAGTSSCCPAWRCVIFISQVRNKGVTAWVIMIKPESSVGRLLCRCVRLQWVYSRKCSHPQSRQAAKNTSLWRKFHSVLKWVFFK